MPLKKMTMGQLLVNEALPEDMRDENRTLDKKGMNALLRQLAEKHPDKYVEVSKKLSDIGRTVATEFGGYSFGLQHLRKSEVAKRNQIEIRGKMRHILQLDRVKAGDSTGFAEIKPGDKTVPVNSEMRNQFIIRMVGGYQQKQIDDIYDEAVKANNPLAMQVVSGSRGNKMNLGSLLGGDMLYSDHRDRVIPLPVLRSYSEGLSPIEYWASTYGARRGTMATKFATQDAGFLSKQLNQVAHRLMVVDEDDDGRFADRGLPVDTDDVDNEGALLAQDVGPYKRNTVITPKIAKHLKGLGHDRLLVRSPLVGGSPDGGVYARDVGVRERGTLPGRGEQVGLTAAQALSEPLSQGQLSAKHSGGVAGQEKAVGGFAYINQLIQVPKKFKGGATHSEFDGKVTDIQKAPAGGNFVFVGNEKHYVPEGIALKVQKGDEIEAGDVLSEGFPNPAIITEHKGVGEGKRYFVNAYRDAAIGAGMKVNRRNVELLARGLINHVRLTDEYGDHVPDDVVPYSTMEHLYEPREGHEVGTPDRAVGRFLERPVLHYSIGTKVRPSVLKELNHFGIKEVATHAEPPPFQANMVRGMYSLQNDPDWMTRMYGSGLKGSLLDATHRGATSDELGTSFVPGLSRAVDFGRVGTVRAPEPGVKPPAEGQPFGEVSRPNLQKPSPPQTTLSPAPDPKKKQGFFSGIFKMSDDEEKRAAEIFAKQTKNVTQVRQAPGKAKLIMQVRGPKMMKTAEQPKVDSTLKPNSGSSTVAPNGMSAPPAPAPAPAPPPPTPAPAQPPVPGQPAQPASPVAPGGVGGVAPGAPPTVHNTPAPAGQVHPDRNAWAGGVGTKRFDGGANPDAFSEGYTPGNGLMHGGEDPDIMRQFVQGGGTAPDGSDGFGGQMGAATRFGSLFDTRAIASLTEGPDRQYRQPDPNGYSDDLIGGNPKAMSPDIMGGFAPGSYQPPPAPNPAEVPGTALPQKFQPVAPNGGTATPAPGGPTATIGGAPVKSQLQNPNHFRDEFAKNFNLAPGNKEFDDLKKMMGPNVTDEQVINAMYGNVRRTAALKKAGYVPGSPKFQEAKVNLQKTLLSKIPNIDGTITEMTAAIKQAEAANPNDPEVMQMKKDLNALLIIKEGKFEDDDIYDYLMETNAVDPNSMSEIELLQEMRGDHTPMKYAMRTLISPVTGPAAFKAGGKAWELMRGKPAEKAVEKAVEKSPSFMGKFLGKSKYLLKKVPVVGWGLEGYDAFNTPSDELRAKFDQELNRPLTPGNVGNYLLDKALNPGQNIRASGIVLNDSANMVNESAKRVQRTIAGGIGVMQGQVRKFEDLAKIRPLTPEEQSEMNQYNERIAQQQQVIKDNVGGRPLTELGGNLTDTKSFTDPRRWDFIMDRDGYKKRNQMEADKIADNKRMEMMQQNYRAKLDLGKSMLGKPVTDPAHQDAINEYVNSITGWNFGSSYGGFGPSTPESVAQDEKYATEAVAELMAARQAIGNTNPELAKQIDGKLDDLGRTPQDRAKKREEFEKTEDPFRKGFDRKGRPMPPKPIDPLAYLTPQKPQNPNLPPGVEFGGIDGKGSMYIGGKLHYYDTQKKEYVEAPGGIIPPGVNGGFGGTPGTGTNLLPGLYGGSSTTPGQFGSFGASPNGSLPGLGGFPSYRGKEEINPNW